MIEAENLRRLLQAAFPGAQVELIDLTGTQDHYQVSVVAEAFRGQPRMRQHKMVYEALGDLMRGPIHALSLKTTVPSA
jgi:stress-induced morphogen